MILIILGQHCLRRFLFAQLYLRVIIAQFEQGLRRRSSIDNSLEQICQDAFIGGQMGDDVFDRPDAADTRGLPCLVGEAIEGTLYSLIAILEDIERIHELSLLHEILRRKPATFRRGRNATLLSLCAKTRGASAFSSGGV